MDFDNIIEYINDNLKPFKGGMWVETLMVPDGKPLEYTGFDIEDPRLETLIRLPYAFVTFGNVYITPKLLVYESNGQVALTLHLDIIFSIDEEKTLSHDLLTKHVVKITYDGEGGKKQERFQDLPKEEREEIGEFIIDEIKKYYKDSLKLPYTKFSFVERHSWLDLEKGNARLMDYFKNMLKKSTRIVGLDNDLIGRDYNLKII